MVTKIVGVKEGFPACRFSIEEAMKTVQAIIVLIDQVPFEKERNRLIESAHNKEVLIINCNDSAAVD